HQGHEFLFAGDVLQRITACPLLQQFEIPVLSMCRQNAVPIRIQVRPAASRGITKQNSGIIGRSIDPCFFQYINAFSVSFAVSHAFLPTCYHSSESSSTMTFFIASMATSIWSSSGSLVVRYCRSMPGALN